MDNDSTNMNDGMDTSDKDQQTDSQRGSDRMEADTSYSPASETEQQQRQQEPRTSEATDDPDINKDDVKVLPGTGGPDDVGDVQVDERDLNLDG